MVPARRSLLTLVSGLRSEEVVNALERPVLVLQPPDLSLFASVVVAVEEERMKSIRSWAP